MQRETSNAVKFGVCITQRVGIMSDTCSYKSYISSRVSFYVI